ncbi:recombinase family protein [Sandarakinorhabdus cyanobacteriorum]
MLISGLWLVISSMIETRNESSKRNPAVAYCRVSTRRQAENELSLSEQQSAIEDYARRHGYDVRHIYVDAGISGTTDRRPELQRLIHDSATKPPPFGAVLVYSTSRFFRNANEAAAYRLKLAKRNIRLISVTQDFGEGPEAELAIHLVCAVDQYSSSINSSQVRLVMAANAAAGYWNGSRPPFGFRVEDGPLVGQRRKKLLVIDATEAAVVKRVFNLYVYGEHGSGPQGLKAIVTRLNHENVCLRGKRFIASTVSDLLRREVYVGRHYYNMRDSKAGILRPREEWIETRVPIVIDQDTFDAAQRRLAMNKPQVTPPRRVNSPTLLSTIGKCGEPNCGAGLILVTGKGGRYRYLTCQTRRTMASDACSLPNYRMADVDEAVIAALEHKLLQPERLKDLLAGLLEKTDSARAERKQRLAHLRRTLTESEGARARMLDAIEAGALDFRDTVVRERLDARRQEIQRLQQEIRTIEDQDRDRPARQITPGVLDRFAKMMREALRSEDYSFRKAYLTLLVAEVRLSSAGITIRGTKGELETLIAKVSETDGQLVPTFAGNWRAQQDSNLRPRA